MSIDKKELIIQTAISLFSEKGFEGTSIRDLAQKAEVNLAMVNYYFGSKEKLFEAIVEEKVRYIRGRIEDLENDKNLSEIEKIDLIIEAYVDRFLSYPDFHKVMEQEMLVSQRKDLHKKVIEIVTQNINNFTKIIEKGIRKKVFKKVDAPLLFASIIGTINQVLKSKQICCVYIFRESNKDFNPYSDEHFRKRLVTHIQQMVHSTLLQS
ncbi:MAG: TetR family transcriptional regulator [Hydrotalea flava]|uniref:TetR/AcrR family transcriptional regulator n=1 Tax=Hydrotalea TaxID=1004300 RepID=UPI000943AA36|nr:MULTISPECIES: TetR/AcrR family transcriptional regulator [Hydrotalea]MBY0348050.1 TetR/AcrR family transcriptional regulator [Hydrotalea flava]NIM36531.1 TetR family transcriptional regulator [Hydrotalea flava]NIM39390.1 TetR family transcriptional regulator [Hydrotalea flava]NIN04579.1 TetR family transcriptional regulator [Hydrotalea flava]NIN16251.1 TetR family transcriptional regulator [Hydrotalea flava]